jgi:hypothetical protein
VILFFNRLLFDAFSFKSNANDATLTSESGDDLQRMLHTFKIQTEKYNVEDPPARQNQ